MQETFAASSRPTGEALSRPPGTLFAVRTETWVYTVIALLALGFRLAQLGALPLSAEEAPAALAAWKLLNPGSFVTATTATSPLLFAAQAATFSVLGATELTARLLTALAGVGVVLSPLLFRRLIGRTRALLLTLTLFFSPVLLLASRTSSPVVWAVLLMAIAGAATWQFAATGRTGFALLATTAVVATVLLADPAGYWLVLILIGAALLTRWTGRTEDDAEPDERLARLNGWPWLQGLAVALLVVFVVSTLFLLHQRGFNNIGALLDAGARGMASPVPGAPPLYTLLIGAFYEPFAWLFGLIGLLLAWRRGFPTLDRFFALWLLLGLIASLVYVGGGAAYALWVTLPLAGLTSRSLVEALREDPRNIWHFPGWARWLVAVIVFGLMAVLATALMLVGRSMMRLDPLLGAETLSRLDPIGIILTVMVVLFSLVGFFLVASVWDRATAARGTVLGLLLFGLVTALGAGWNAAVPRWTLATEPWHLRPPTDNVYLLRETLFDVADRTSRGFPSYTVAALAPGDGLLAWALRDFTDVRLIESVTEAGDAPVVLLPGNADIAPPSSLASGYVGQDFVLQRGWSIGSLRAFDLLAWWLQRNTADEGQPLESVDFWLRGDLYSGVSAE
jgi:hypothetical protein